jgi:hypothetical protein
MSDTANDSIWATSPVILMLYGTASVRYRTHEPAHCCSVTALFTFCGFCLNNQYCCFNIQGQHYCLHISERQTHTAQNQVTCERPQLRFSEKIPVVPNNQPCLSPPASCSLCGKLNRIHVFSKRINICVRQAD